MCSFESNVVRILLAGQCGPGSGFFFWSCLPVGLPQSAIVGLENLPGLPLLLLGIAGALWIFLTQGPLDNGLVFPDG